MCDLCQGYYWASAEKDIEISSLREAAKPKSDGPAERKLQEILNNRLCDVDVRDNMVCMCCAAVRDVIQSDDNRTR
jgi:hypothetical protein